MHQPRKNDNQPIPSPVPQNVQNLFNQIILRAVQNQQNIAETMYNRLENVENRVNIGLDQLVRGQARIVQGVNHQIQQIQQGGQSNQQAGQGQGLHMQNIDQIQLNGQPNQQGNHFVQEGNPGLVMPIGLNAEAENNGYGVNGSRNVNQHGTVNCYCLVQ